MVRGKLVYKASGSARVRGQERCWMPRACGIVLCSSTLLHRDCISSTPRARSVLSTSTNWQESLYRIDRSTPPRWRRQVASDDAANCEEAAACRPASAFDVRPTDRMTNGSRRTASTSSCIEATRRDNWRHNARDNQACTHHRRCGRRCAQPLKQRRHVIKTARPLCDRAGARSRRNCDEIRCGEM